jgi:transcriptional regulator with XRE-family HTH domain
MLPQAPELGKALKHFRLEKQWTQKTMATFLGISRASLSYVEHGAELSELNRYKVEKKIGQLLEMAAA